MKKAFNLLIVLLLTFTTCVFAEEKKSSANIKFVVNDFLNSLSDNGFVSTFYNKDENPLTKIEYYYSIKDNNIIYTYSYETEEDAIKQFKEYYDSEKEMIEYEYSVNDDTDNYQAYSNFKTDDLYVNVVRVDNYLILATCDYEDKKMIDNVLSKNDISVMDKDYQKHSSDKYGLVKIASIIMLTFILIAIIVMVLVFGKINKKHPKKKSKRKQ